MKNEYDINSESYNKLINRLKLRSIKAKKTLLSNTFEIVANKSKKEEGNLSFVIKFEPFLRDLVLFPDEEVYQKLREFKCSKHTLKWMVNIEEIHNELEILSEIEGLTIFPLHYLIAIKFYLELKFWIYFIEDCGLFTEYNNMETNYLFELINNIYRKRDYNFKKSQTPKMNEFEKNFNLMLDDFEKKISDKGEAKKMMLKATRGEGFVFLQVLNSFACTGISKSKGYLELFPLLQLIVKDRVLYSHAEYDKNNDKYDADYDRYQIARVKKILTKK